MRWTATYFLCLFVFISTRPARSQEPTEFKILNAATAQERLTVDICLEKECRSYSLESQSLSEMIQLKPGLYDFKVKSQDSTLDSFRYSIAGSKHYTLALYGLAAKPVHRSTMTKLFDVLSGSEKVSPADYQLRHKMIDVTPKNKTEPMVVKVGHLAAGTSAIKFQYKVSDQTVDFKALKYQGISGIKQSPSGPGEVAVTLPGAHQELAHSKISPGAGDNVLIIFSQFSGNSGQLVIDVRSNNIK